MTTTLIIPAAGTGTRYLAAAGANAATGDTIPKQFLDLHGRPVLAWSLAAFAGLVDDAVLAVNPAGRAALDALLAAHPPAYPVTVVTGGDTRQASVHAALHAATGDLILVHDAVRPLVAPALIRACIAALAVHHAAVVAVPCAATVKRAAPGNLVAETVPRDHLHLAQTPQGFHRSSGLDAFARAAAEHWSCSDDAQVLERAGYAVALVPGETVNIKITTPDDLAFAKAWLARAAAANT